MAKTDINTPREKAKAAGKKVYIGKPCPYGHDGTRYVSNRRCVGCARVSVYSDVHLAHQSRNKAIANGDIFYDGQVCSKGHGTKRRVANRACVVCEKIADQRFRENNPEACRNKRRKHYYKHLEKNRARCKENSKRYRAENPEKYQVPIKQWRKRNAEKVKLYSKNYQSKRRSQEKQGVSSFELGKWIDLQQKVCHWCGTDCKSSYHIDHYFPLSKGGKHEIENMVIACPKCNLEKNAKCPYEFAKQRGRLF